MSETLTSENLSFQQILRAVDKLGETERLILRKKLEQITPLSWQDRFDKALKTLAEKNKDIPLEEVESDVARAIQEVRTKHDR